VKLRVINKLIFKSINTNNRKQERGKGKEKETNEQMNERKKEIINDRNVREKVVGI
jgi:hypothetical protein